MKGICTILCFTVFSLSGSAQLSTSPVSTQDAVKQVSGQSPSKAAVEAVVLKESEYNFGKIPQGKPVTHVFYFTNIGKTSLILDNVQASCGCTTPVWSKEPVSPGATSKIDVGYNAASEGSFTKFITITYNGSQNKQVIIKGEVWKTPVSSAPENSALGNLKNQQ